MSIASLNPSPRRLKPKLVIKIVIPGRVVIHHAERKYCLPSFMIVPQIIEVGSPKPKKVNVLRLNIAPATSMVAETIIGEIVFGMI